MSIIFGDYLPHDLEVLKTIIKGDNFYKIVISKYANIITVTIIPDYKHKEETEVSWYFIFAIFLTELKMYVYFILDIL